jgi:hypothetical protein
MEEPTSHAHTHTHRLKNQVSVWIERERRNQQTHSPANTHTTTAKIPHRAQVGRRAQRTRHTPATPAGAAVKGRCRLSSTHARAHAPGKAKPVGQNYSCSEGRSAQPAHRRTPTHKQSAGGQAACVCVACATHSVQDSTKAPEADSVKFRNASLLYSARSPCSAIKLDRVSSLGGTVTLRSHTQGEHQQSGQKHQQAVRQGSTPTPSVEALQLASMLARKHATWTGKQASKQASRQAGR